MAVVLDGPTVRELRPRAAADGPAEPGLLLPGLVDAHLHLELGWAAGLVPGGEGLGPWVRRLLRLPRPDAPPLDATPLVEAGTAVVCDIANGGHTAEALDAAGLAGVVQHELLGMRRAGLDERLALAERPDRRVGRLWVRPSPHAVYSTPEPLLRAAARPGAAPASIHLAEDPAEAQLLRDGTGPLADSMDAAGIDWRWWTPPGCTPAAWLDRLGLLGPDLLLVHAVHLTDDDRARIAAAGAPVCLCPRSNLHIGGVLPDVAALRAAGVALCLGTDSLASSPDLDVLGEIPPLARANPDVPVASWLALATSGGADALRRPRYGRLLAGTAPGVVRLAVGDPGEVTEAPPARRWEVRPWE
ncbi:MAG: amidohydrolase family protein [Myxococcota bacterium]